MKITINSIEDNNKSTSRSIHNIQKSDNTRYEEAKAKNSKKHSQTIKCNSQEFIYSQLNDAE